MATFFKTNVRRVLGPGEMPALPPESTHHATRWSVKIAPELVNKQESVYETSGFDSEAEKEVAEVEDLSPDELKEYEDTRQLFFKKYTLFNTMLDKIAQRCNEDRDVVIAVTGNQGLGKSSFAILLAIELAKRLGTRSFSIIDDIIWSGEKKEIYRKIYGDYNKKTPVVFDEFLSYASKHKWWSAEQRYLEDVFLVSRTQNKPCILVGPRISDFAEQFRNQRVIINFEILKRGCAAVFVRFPSAQVTDPWFIRQIEKMIIDRGRWFMTAQPNEKAKMYKANVRNFIGLVYYPNLDKKSRRIYNTLSEKAKEKKIRPMNEELEKIFPAKKDEVLAKAVRSMSDKGETHAEVAKTLGVTEESVSKMIKSVNKKEYAEYIKSIREAGVIK